MSYTTPRSRASASRAGLLLLLAACEGEGSKPGKRAEPLADPAPKVDLVKVRLALNWYPEPEFGGFYEGVLGGHYAREGFDVEIIPGGPGAPSLELLGTGRAEAAITAADDLLVKRGKGIQAIGAWPAFQDNPMGLLVHGDSGIQTYADLGKTPGQQLALEVGGPFQIFLWGKYALEGKVELVPTGGTVGAFLANPKLAQQGYITSEPCVARGQGAQVGFLASAEAGWNPYGTLLAFADPPPPWAEAFVAATQAGWDSYLASPDQANREIARLNDQMKPELLACIVAAQRPYLTGKDGLGAMSEARWEDTAAGLVSVGLLPAGSTAKGAWRSFQARGKVTEPPLGPPPPEAPGR